MRGSRILPWVLGVVLVLSLGISCQQKSEDSGQTKQAAVAVAPAGDVAKGKEVFDQCSACHAVDTNETILGPSLKGLYKKGKMANGKNVTDDSVMAVINAGGNGMPEYADLLTKEEKAQLLAYLKTL